MSPSAVETAQQAAEEIKAKTLPIHDKLQETPAQHESLEVKPVETSNGSNGTTGSAAKPGALPERYEAHKEPLKLSGVLDQFSSFDITPVIGREYIGVDLAKWLRAPNSDELLRDLAITSQCPRPPFILLETNTNQSPSVASSSSAPKITSPTISKRSSSSASANSPASRQRPSCTSTLSPTLPASTAARTTKSPSSPRSR
jgi:hypothetical protein